MKLSTYNMKISELLSIVSKAKRDSIVVAVDKDGNEIDVEKISFDGVFLKIEVESYYDRSREVSALQKEVEYWKDKYDLLENDNWGLRKRFEKLEKKFLF